MISSTQQTYTPRTQAIRPAENPQKIQKAAAGTTPKVRFGQEVATPSPWERIKQGALRLWEFLISPFKIILSWFKTPETSPKATETTGPVPSPSQNHDPSTKSTLPAVSAEVQLAAPADPSPSVTPPPLVLKTRPNPQRPPIPESPAVQSQAKPLLKTPEDLDLQTAIERSEISAREEDARRLAQEKLEARELNRVIQISSDATLAQNLHAQQNELAPNQITNRPTPTPQAASSSQVSQAGSVANTTSPALMEELFGPELTDIQFRQQSGNTCYLLSSLDAIFHHPQGKQILEKIKITRTPDGYAVTFPGQPQPVIVSTGELGRLRLANGDDVPGVKSECEGVSILECAYSKIPNPIFGEEDESKNALARIFGPDHEVINIQNARSQSEGVLRNAAGQPIAVDIVNGVRRETLLPWQADHRIGKFEFKHDERVEQFRQYIQHAQTQEELDIVTAKPFDEAHYYSVRLDKSTPKTIVLANPFNTAPSIEVEFDSFMEQYDIEGIRLPR
ncbi:hypothetical protein [Vampirovibrio chlorellavorus]|uniref:hypothetical protein n=1 Tax=Vampirovibrio chlorellavorus TaxID=758823 RepID=UPI0026EA1896|nr:hypothetical protein [Vampirovibrio chlorellavorus]